MPNYVRSFAGVPKQGTQRMQIFTPQFTIIAPRSGAASEGIMDDTGQHSYRFDTDR
jgi:hypothetical protein